MNVGTEKLAENYKQKYPFTFTKAVAKDEPFLTMRYERAWEIAKKAAIVLKSNYGATKVVVFGLGQIWRYGEYQKTNFMRR